MVKFLIKHRGNKIFGKIVQKILLIIGCDIHPGAQISDKAQFIHPPFGTVMNNRVIIKDNAKIFHGVTLGKAEPWLPDDVAGAKIGYIILEEGSLVGAGAKILMKNGDIVVGKNTVIGANAVLTKSTGEGEIWAGIPAKKIGHRDDEYMI